MVAKTKAGKGKSLSDGNQRSSRPSRPSLSSQPGRKRKAPKKPAAPKRRSSRLRAKMLPTTECKVEPDQSEEETPEEKIQRLEKRLNGFTQDVLDMRLAYTYTKGNFACWESGWIDHWPKTVGGIFYSVDQWAIQYGHADIKSFDRCLTKDQKNQLIASLDGYCLQEDYDSVLSRISPSIHRHVPYLFLAAYVNKFIVKHFIEDAMWYMTTRPDPADRDESSRDNDANLVKELNRFYEIFSKVSLDYARTWRTLTIRLCNSVRKDQGQDLTFGRQMREHRNDAARSLAFSLLADPILQLLLREPECPSRERRRTERLCAQFENAAQIAALVCADYNFIEIHDLSKEAPLFYHTSKTVRAWPLHGIDEESGDATLDGQRVVILTRPAVVGVPRWSVTGETYVPKKGTVLIEDLRELL